MRRQLLLMAIAATGFGACGLNGDEPGRSVTVPAGRTVALVADEYRFDPGRVVVTGFSGEPLRISLRNEGSLAHDVRVLDGERDLGGVRPFRGGAPRSAEVTLARGSYRLVCTVGDHEQLGMFGELELR